MRLLYLAFPLLCSCTLLKATTVTRDFLQGQWTLDSSSRDERCLPPEEYYPPMPADNVWIISGDSISMFDYPSRFIGTCLFRLVKDSLYLDPRPDNDVRYRRGIYAIIEADSDRLTLHMDECVTMIFRRDTFDERQMKTINVLTRDTLNPFLLVGKYRMITQFFPEDEEAYYQFPPVSMKTTIRIADTAAARRIIHQCVIRLSANGVVRDFYVAEIGFKESYYHDKNGVFRSTPYAYFVVMPGSWWTGEVFEVRYEQPDPHP